MNNNKLLNTTLRKNQNKTQNIKQFISTGTDHDPT